MISKTAKGEVAEDTLDAGTLAEHEKAAKNGHEKPYKVELVWESILFFGYMHLAALYGLYLVFTSAKLATTIFAIIVHFMAGFGITAGAHRLWSHRAYKATWQLRLILTFFFTIALMHPVVDWARDHRVHHKFSETNADPYNAKRGFFFAQIGWVLCRKHPELKEKGKGIDVSDLYSDPILRFQKKYYLILVLLCCFVLPTIIPVYCWNESWTNAYHIPAVLRWVCTTNGASLVNSLAHKVGNKPYERSIYPSQNLTVSIIALGEGWHNYHHTFPWDYRTSELGDYGVNFTNAFIDFFAWLGWAYDLKTVPVEVIKARVLRTGDGTHELWGWGDKDLTKEDQQATMITRRQS